MLNQLIQIILSRLERSVDFSASDSDSFESVEDRGREGGRVGGRNEREGGGEGGEGGREGGRGGGGGCGKMMPEC